MSFTKEFRKVWLKVKSKASDSDYNYKEVYKQRVMDFRKFKSTVTRIDNPINVVRARTLGYKAKKGVFTVIVRTKRGGGLFRAINKARRPKRKGFKKLTRNISIQRISEQKASKKYLNCEVVNSYLVGEDGKYKYYNVILASKTQPEVKKDPQLKNIVKVNARAERGLTSASKKGRGLKK